MLKTACKAIVAYSSHSMHVCCEQLASHQCLFRVYDCKGKVGKNAISWTILIKVNFTSHDIASFYSFKPLLPLTSVMWPFFFYHDYARVYRVWFSALAPWGLVINLLFIYFFILEQEVKFTLSLVLLYPRKQLLSWDIVTNLKHLY